MLRLHDSEVRLRYALPCVDELNGKFLQQGVDLFSFVTTVLHNLLGDLIYQLNRAAEVQSRAAAQFGSDHHSE